MSLPPERRRQLQELGLRALVKRHFGADVAEAARRVNYGGGAALIAPRAADTPLAAVFADAPTGLGPAIDIAHREGAGHLYFFAELTTRAVARRAAEFTLATTAVSPEGDFEALVAEPPEPPEPLPSALLVMRQRFETSGLEPTWEHGVLSGEWRGLEVARATLGGEDPGQAIFEVGVGKHDREGNRMLYPDGPSDGLLAHAVSTVVALRRSGAAPHPANQLVPERWLRAVLRACPEVVGLSAVTSAPPAEPREDLRRRGVAPAWGIDAFGRPTVVVCSVGVDPDLVPQAADARLHAPLWPDTPAVPAGDWRLVIAVPEGDDHPVTHRLAALLRQPAEVVTVPATWRALDC